MVMLHVARVRLELDFYLKHNVDLLNQHDVDELF